MPNRLLNIVNLVAVIALGAMLFAAPQPALSESRTAGMDVVDTSMDTPSSEASADVADISSDVPATAADAEHSADAAVPAHGEHAAEAGHEESKGGFPQLDTTTYASQIFWLAVSFVLLYTLMSRVSLPRITEVLELRQTQREGNLNRAEQLQEEAEKVKATVDAALAKAQAEAQEALNANEQQRAKKAAAENARFLEHARTRIANAEQNIAKAKEEALHSLADISAEIAAEITQKIAATNISKADAKKVVTDIMKEAA